MAPLAFGLPSWSLFQIGSVLVLVLGFGFVIFFHELGHFLAAKWVGIKVEQFAVGFGQALFSWRKGIGIRLGNTQKEYQKRLDASVAAKLGNDFDSKDKSSEVYQRALIEAEKESGLGETEYRLNWIPLGGYVKMLGQDDLRPNSEAADPRSYNRKSIGARMLVVSAGVIMNVILAGIGFMILFMIGFHVPPAWAGGIVSGSPAQNVTDASGKRTSLRVGDQVIEFDGRPQEDFTKIGLWVALSKENTPVPITVRHLDGTVEEYQITPKIDETTQFLSIGIAAPRRLEGLDPKDIKKVETNWQNLALKEEHTVLPGDVITAIDGRAVKPEDYWVLDQAMQNPGGKPVELTIRDADGKTEVRSVEPHFEPLFSNKDLDFAGMLPRPQIASVAATSTAVGKVLPGDIVVKISWQGAGNDSIDLPSTEQLRQSLSKAGGDNQKVSLGVIRDGKQLPPINDLSPNITVDKDKSRKGLGVGLKYDDSNAVIANVVSNSPAEAAHLKTGDRVVAIDGQSVSNWFDVQRLLAAAKPGKPISIATINDKNQTPRQETALTLNSDQIYQIASLRRSSFLSLREYNIIRQARTLNGVVVPASNAEGHLNPWIAAYWGVTETRDFILQFYLTLRRMVGGSVSPSQLMGPVGIFVGGANFAFRGWDWNLWFLAMISANLAVVNFLPIPIVDGGLFTFLILEKIQGRPLSPKTQAIAQYVGLAFLAGVFIFVTWHDITRFL